MGDPTLVPSDPTSKPPPVDLFRGWPNDSLLPASDLAKAAGVVLSTESIYTPALRYGPDEGYEPLRHHVAEWLTDFYAPEEPITADRICITGGASQNLASILQVFTDPAYTQTIWMVAPTYYLACRIFDDAGFAGRLRAVPEDDEGIDVEFLERQLQLQEEKGYSQHTLKSSQPWRRLYRSLIYAVPTFANPSMKVMSLQRREQLIRLARRYDGLIVTDDVYDFLHWPASDQYFSGQAPNRAVVPRLVDVDRYLDGGPIHEWGNTVSNASFSKLIGPGVRTGWAESTPKFSWGLSQTGSSRSGGAPSQLTAAMIDQLVSSGTLNMHIAYLQRNYEIRYHKIKSAIQSYLLPLGFSIPTLSSPSSSNSNPTADPSLRTSGNDSMVAGGYFIWLRLPHSIRASDLAQKAEEEENLQIGNGALFQVVGDPLEFEEWIRLCFAWEKVELLEEGIRRLGKVAVRLSVGSG